MHLSVGVGILLLGLVSANDLDFVEEGEERTIFTSGGTYYIALNTTYLIYYSFLAGIIVLGGVLLSSLFGEPEASGGYGQYQNKRADYQQDAYRQKRDAYDYSFTEQVVLLADAFKKYGLQQEVGCQLYVACESGKIAQHKKNGRLAKEVHTLLSGMTRAENEPFYKNDGYLKDLFSSFKIGSIGSSCAKFRKQCRKNKIF